MPYLGRKFYKNTHFLRDFLDESIYNQYPILDPIRFFHTENNYEAYIYEAIDDRVFNCYLLFKKFLFKTKLEDEILKTVKP